MRIYEPQNICIHTVIRICYVEIPSLGFGDRNPRLDSTPPQFIPITHLYNISSKQMAVYKYFSRGTRLRGTTEEWVLLSYFVYGFHYL